MGLDLKDFLKPPTSIYIYINQNFEAIFNKICKKVFLPFKAGVPSSKWRIGLACFRLDMILGWNWLKLWQLIKSSSENMSSSESHPNIQIRTAVSIWYQSCWESCRFWRSTGLFHKLYFRNTKNMVGNKHSPICCDGTFFDQIGATVYYMY